MASNVKQITYSDSSSDEECGIYNRKIQQTKKEIVQSHKENNLLEVKRMRKKYNDKNSYDTSDGGDKDAGDDDVSDDSNSTDNEPRIMTKKSSDNQSSSTSNSCPPSPPPPPSPPTIEYKRKTNKALKDLEFLTQQSRMLKKKDESLNETFDAFNESDIDNLITIRVIAKNGCKKFDYKRDESFKRLFEEVARVEKCNVENLVLMFNEKKLTFDETPKSVKYETGDLIECGKSTKKIQERIRIIENSDEEKNVESQIVITLQGEEGRKSRVKLLVYKDEPFGTILDKYCQKRELNAQNFIMEFDGDHVGLKETPNSLDLEGGEIIDVKKSTKTSLEHVKQNQKNYEFDDDILCV